MNKDVPIEDIITDGLQSIYYGRRAGRVAPWDYTPPLTDPSVQNHDEWCEGVTRSAVSEWARRTGARRTAVEKLWKVLRCWYLDGINPQLDRQRWRQMFGEECEFLCSAVYMVAKLAKQKAKSSSVKVKEFEMVA